MNLLKTLGSGNFGAKSSQSSSSLDKLTDGAKNPINNLKKSSSDDDLSD